MPRCGVGFTAPTGLLGGVWAGTRLRHERHVAPRARPAAVARRRTPVRAVAAAGKSETPLQGSVDGSRAKLLEQYVKQRGGHRVLRKVLIANNGMAATKSILSMRQWAYCTFGDEKLIEFVAMATPEDLNANAEFIRLADTFVEVPGGSNKNNYANVDLIVATAIRERVDAVWPGWGHASENPRLPNSLKQNGIVFIGPPGPVMAVLGDKIAANILAQTAKVPSIPWSGDGLTAELNEEGTIPKEIFDKAMVRTADEALAAAERIGYPVMLKASEGGGGKGIRMSYAPEELQTNFQQVANEVPGSPMFMMQLCKNARHLEVQIVGDEHGNAVALNGRDCSTQRRFQKIFEEGPPSIAPVETFRKMERAAQRLTQSIGYVGAGTVEYLFNAESDTFFFLELNPRLQVEHPVTEGLTEVNLPATQLQVAMGIPLNRIPQIRRFYERDEDGEDLIDFMTESYRPIRKHVVAARITAENPDEGFKPTSGRIERVKFQSSPNVWGYFSVGAQGGIHEFADSQFGHVFASGDTREAARKALVLALKEVEARGEIRNPVEYLVQLLETDEFKENTIDTAWLDRLIREKLVQVRLDTDTVVLNAAVYRAWTYVKNEIKKCEEQLRKGQTSGGLDLAALSQFPVEITYQGVKYNFEVSRLSPDIFQMNINGQSIELKVREQSDESLLVTLGSNVRKVTGQEEPLGLRILIDGATALLPNVFDPSELRSDVTGKVVRYLQEAGDEVEKGTPYVELEAMKMIMQISAGESGKIKHELSPGSIIKTGDLLASLELEDPSRVATLVPFDGKLNVDESGIVSPEDRSRYAFERLGFVFDGYYDDPEPLVTMLFDNDDTDETMERVFSLIDKYFQVEVNFGTEGIAGGLLSLIRRNKKDVTSPLQQAIAHNELGRRNQTVLALLRRLATLSEVEAELIVPDNLANAVSRLKDLPGGRKDYGAVKVAANDLLTSYQLPTLESRLDGLRELIMNGRSFEDIAKDRALSVTVDYLTTFFTDADAKVRNAALEVFIRRIYRAHCVNEFSIIEGPGGVPACTWSFQYSDTPVTETPIRKGMLVLPGDFDTASKTLDQTLELFKELAGDDDVRCNDENLNVLMLVLDEKKDRVVDEESTKSESEIMLRKRNVMLHNLGLRTVTLVFPQLPKQPRYFSFNHCDDFQESPIRRDMRPTFPYLLELTNLAVNYDLTRLPAVGRNAQNWLGTEKQDSSVFLGRPQNQTVFFRAISHTNFSIQGLADKILLRAMDEVELALSDPRVSPTASSNIFIHVLQEYDSDQSSSVVRDASKILDDLIPKFATRLQNLRVDNIELRLRIQGDVSIQPMQLIASSSTTSGEWLKTNAYVGYPDPVTGVTKEYRALLGEGDKLVSVPVPTANPIQVKRAAARRVGSTYVYDFLNLLEIAVIRSWKEHPETQRPDIILSAQEMILDGDELSFSTRPAGLNKVGMVGWLLDIQTPEYPRGREIVVIANDVTVKAGSFGVDEDDFFFKASEFARVRGLPRIYLACNSGARIGLDEKLKPQFMVEWVNPSNPSMGFKYLYLTEDDYMKLPEGTVHATKTITKDGAAQYVLDDIVGEVHGIGVENLRGSGMIAGETSRAYDETFTLSYITGRTVGIGAYLVRLGQRTIQMVNGPMILTGYMALNKLLGRDVYSSQDQLGGPEVMLPNGVTHEVVGQDQDGADSIIRWLSYVPKTKWSPCPILPPSDPIDRTIEFMPSKTPYDPREMLAGIELPNGDWKSGFFDRGSFKEYLSGWGKSVVTGRARLGGIPMGIIAVETRLVDRVIPADPANPESGEVLEPQAGQVWFPDSAYKTAQAIEDFNRGENLPLMIFANWRGFSGGSRDMFGEILKYGSMIVDALRKYEHPVSIYLPPNGELRGGAWVVVDPTINEEMMEMYADAESRGGILEPPGICEVKFRKADQLKTMHRLDAELITLDGELARAESAEVIDDIKQKVSQRENTLLPVYLQVAHEFADLHDRAGRMKAKGVIREQLNWVNSREYFYWRTKRRLLEIAIRRRIQASCDLSQGEVTATLQRWIDAADWDDDRAVIKWLESNGETIEQHLDALKAEGVQMTINALLKGLSDSQRQTVIEGL